MNICGFGQSFAYAGTGASPPAPSFWLWRCPLCQGSGRWSDGERCLECSGKGVVDTEPDPEVWNGDGEHVRAPLPPALMTAPCGDCAFRAGSPEHETGDHGADYTGGPIGPDRPFWCHHQLHNNGAEYVPTAQWNGAPLGAMLCRGWWDVHVEKLPPPDREYREPRGRKAE